MTGTDVLELDAEWLDETRGLAGKQDVSGRQGERGVDELNAHAALLKGLADGSLVGKLAFVDVAAGWEPQTETPMTVKQDAALVDDEDRDGELADGGGRGPGSSGGRAAATRCVAA